MSVTNPRRCEGDISDAAKVIHALLQNLKLHKGAKRKHKVDLQYLQHYLLPKLHLMGGYVRDILDCDDHPRKAEWEADLAALGQAWQNFEEYLKSRHGLLLERPDHDCATDDLAAWTWDELSVEIEHVKQTAQAALDDMDRLILLEICERFGLVLPRLDTMFEKIESYGDCVSTYRKDVQEVLWTIRSNKQDFKSLKGLLERRMSDLVQRIGDSQSAIEALKSQLQFMSEKLNLLLAQLSRQRKNCETKADRKYLDQLCKEVKKQTASVARLRSSVDETSGVMAEFLRASGEPDVGKENSHWFSRMTSSLERLCDVLKRQASIFMFWRRAKSTAETSSDDKVSEIPDSAPEPQKESSDTKEVEDGDSVYSTTPDEHSPPVLNENPESVLSETSTSPSETALEAPQFQEKTAGIRIRDLAILLASPDEDDEEEEEEETKEEEEEEEEEAAAGTTTAGVMTTSVPPLPRRSSARRRSSVRKSYQYLLRTAASTQRQSFSLSAVPEYLSPAAAGAMAKSRRMSRAQLSTSSSWSSMSLAMSSSEADSPCPDFAAQASLPSPPSSVYDESFPPETTHRHTVATVQDRALALSLLEQLEKRFSLTVVTACN
ncbi:hypothetical protein Z517_12563 [Fonsecaea pedrosoi CBS 271.37]|uniref:Uncharacterized protein n=1 Tax=Fonsecaea pedrosoi CBS 271.37 TaxID=1442368 RepID=A0A0D2G036_9EURO|nr:uncharacterized protein Z517_12563 [Fonsecaea pedrosoi CBS 271.37]KIW74153.1 hypothetical protein Z517_12563 [Fonsecaea pedrosoi CBS 271.37]